MTAAFPTIPKIEETRAMVAYMNVTLLCRVKVTLSLCRSSCPKSFTSHTKGERSQVQLEGAMRKNLQKFSRVADFSSTSEPSIGNVSIGKSSVSVSVSGTIGREAIGRTSARSMKNFVLLIV